MAGSPGECWPSCATWRRRARPHAERELAELREFAARELGLPDLQAWDRAYAAEKLRQSRYAFSEQELKQYFTEPRVLAGLFRLVETLFDVAIRERQAPRVARQRALLSRLARRRSRWRRSTSTSTPAPASGRAPGWTTCRARWRRPDGGTAVAGGAPGVQLRAAAGRPPRAADPRRRDHAVPRIRPRPAPHADAGRRHRRSSGISGVEGTRWNCPASSWRTSAGNGTCCSA